MFIILDYDNQYTEDNDLIGLVPVPEGVKCLTCGKILSNLQNARRHYKIIHATDKNDKKFKCPICHRGFAVESYKVDHMRCMHGITKTMLQNKIMP